ncbi:MAG: tRNA pseudouridine55 synthase [bacterium P3]|nr:MAG: tRNA pseudouridine55 synthase [bacterium P3]KWW42021.1 MAG: tRNA pseudouridine55 synthase [bacterium F083]
MTAEELLAGVVIPIDKPRQWTSFQAVNKVKAIIRNRYGLKKIKIGHAGTLDPLATGLLLVCVGRATKEIDRLQQGDKIYTGTMVLGATTPCYDLEQPIDRHYPFEHITPTLLDTVRQQFIGKIEQVPPIFSAVKIDGQRAYTYARADNTEAVPASKQVHVAEFDITAYRPGSMETAGEAPQTTENKQTEPNKLHRYNNPVNYIPAHLPQLDFRIRCGKGTYIRSIARDIGIALHSGAFLAALRREQAGDYNIQQSVALEQVEAFLDGNETIVKSEP